MLLAHILGCAGLGGTWTGNYDGVDYSVSFADGLFDTFAADVELAWSGATFTDVQDGAVIDGEFDISGGAVMVGEASMVTTYRFAMPVDESSMSGTCVFMGQADTDTFLDGGGYDCVLARE